MNWNEITHKLTKDKKQSISLLLLLCFGVILMLLPNTGKSSISAENEAAYIEKFSIEREEARLAETLSCIEGVYDCKVLLAVHDGAETILAEDDGETVVLSNSGKQSAVTIQTRYPEFQGAIIVAGGTEVASVRYDILSSVMAYTGLGADRITICPIKE